MKKMMLPALAIAGAMYWFSRRRKITFEVELDREDEPMEAPVREDAVL
jgi:hypothetical protein